MEIQFYISPQGFIPKLITVIDVLVLSSEGFIFLGISTKTLQATNVANSKSKQQVRYGLGGADALGTAQLEADLCYLWKKLRNILKSSIQQIRKLSFLEVRLIA